MKDKFKKIFSNYREQLIHLAKIYNISEIKNYASINKRLTNKQLELLLIKNNIKIPLNTSSIRAIQKHEVRQNSITNIYLTLCFLLFLTGVIVSRPYIKNIVNEVKFTYVASEYKEPLQKKKKVVKKNEKKIDDKSEIQESDNSNTVSLNAQTTLNLFQDLEYDLKGIRSGQKVKPIYLTKLPKDIKSLGDTREKRELFIKIVLPLILHENNQILEDRKKLFKILAKNFNTAGERMWLKKRFKEYKIEDKDLGKLKIRMDTIPVSIALAQAANESGWGTSRFALEGNALFGQWTWSKKGIEPSEQDSDKTHKVLQFQILKASVRAYKNNLNTHNAYREFREARAILREDNKQVKGLQLTKHLHRYASIGKKYTKLLENIIRNNSLEDFDKANLLSTKLKSGVAL